MGVDAQGAGVVVARQVELGQILYGGDNLDSENWDSREWNKNWTGREKLIELAIETCLEL